MKITLLLTLFLLSGTIVFGQDNSLSKTIEFYRPDYMVPIFLYVNSNTGRGSYTGNPQNKRNNFPKQIIPAINFPRNSVSLSVKPDEDAVFAEKYKGIKLYLVNTTDQEVGFSAVDHSLYIVQEALKSGRTR